MTYINRIALYMATPPDPAIPFRPHRYWVAGTSVVGLEGEDQSGLPIHAGADGRRQAGLRNAWELAAHHLGGEVQRFVQAERDHLLDHLRKRNHSILAHGDLPIARADWEAFAAWIESALIPLLRDRAAGVGLKTLAPQLPRRPLWS